MVVEIPIEIRVKEKDEIKQIINDMKEADTQSAPSKKKEDPLGIKNKRNANGVVTRKELNNVINERFGQIDKITDLLQGGAGGFVGQLTGFATKLAPPMAIALTAVGFIKKIIDIMFAPGGPFDRRFNEFEQRTNKLISTSDQALKRQGEKTVRITSYYSSRGGRDTTFTTLDPLRKGQYVFDRDLNLLSKGVTE